MINMAHLRSEAIRLYQVDPAAAQLLQQAGDEIQRLQVQRDALLPASELQPAPAPMEAPHG